MDEHDPEFDALPQNQQQNEQEEHQPIQDDAAEVK